MADIDWDGINKALENYKQSIANINKQLEETPKKVFENGEYCVWLISLGEYDDSNSLKRKLEVMAKIQEYFSKGIAVNKRLVDNLPSKLEINLSYEDCLNIQKDFNSIGCETKVLKMNEPLYEGKFKIELLNAGEDKIETVKKIKEHFNLDNASALQYFFINKYLIILKNKNCEKFLFFYFVAL